jgi:hypothetical protein
MKQGLKLLVYPLGWCVGLRASDLRTSRCRRPPSPGGHGRGRCRQAVQAAGRSVEAEPGSRLAAADG